MTEFSVSSFLLQQTEEPSLSQMFLLDGFGNGLIYSTYDSHFSTNPPVFFWSVWDIRDTLRNQNVYLPLATKYLALHAASYEKVSDTTITYSLLLVTDSTPLYEFGLTFQINTDKVRNLTNFIFARSFGTYNPATY